jgi:hypothetical protein
MSDSEVHNEPPQQPPSQPPTSPPPDERRRDRNRDEKGEKDERDEKDEKDREKSEKDEKYTRDPLSAIVWALIFIGAGVVLLLESTGLIYFGRYLNAWQIIMAVAGVVLLLEAAVRLIVPAYRRPVLGTIILGFILLSIGLGGFARWELIWPVVLILVGLSIILGGLFRGRL